MEIKCRKYWQAGKPGFTGHLASVLGCPSGLTAVPCDHVTPRVIAFDVEPHTQGNLGVSVPIPGYDAPGLALKFQRDPSLSLIALSGIEPSGPVMVEVPLVENNMASTATQTLIGRRVGFAERFADDPANGLIEHSSAFLRALDILRRCGAELVPVRARRANHSLQTRNEIDELVRQHQLDALVCDSASTAFHLACWSGYPKFGEPLGDGATLWFYGARWAKDWLEPLVKGYRSARRAMEIA